MKERHREGIQESYKIIKGIRGCSKRRKRKWGCFGLTLGNFASERTGQVCVQCQRQCFMPLVVVKRWQHWTQGHGMASRKVRSTHTSTHTLSLAYTRVAPWAGPLDAAVRTSVCYIPSAVMTIWWDLMLLYCELYQNWQGHPCILMSCLFPTTLRLCLSLIAAPLATLWLSFSISLLNKQRQKDYGDKFNKDKLKDWVRGHRSDWACVFERVRVRLCVSMCQHLYV